MFFDLFRPIGGCVALTNRLGGGIAPLRAYRAHFVSASIVILRAYALLRSDDWQLREKMRRANAIRERHSRIFFDCMGRVAKSKLLAAFSSSVRRPDLFLFYAHGPYNLACQHARMDVMPCFRSGQIG
jgi:hypothetical protein